MGEANINTDIWTGGGAGNMESKNKSGIEGDVERFRHFVYFGRNSPPPPVGHGLLINEVSRSHTTTHRSR